MQGTKKCGYSNILISDLQSEANERVTIKLNQTKEYTKNMKIILSKYIIYVIAKQIMINNPKKE